MTLSTVAPSAGWFPDPGDPAQERWWSGESWTEHHREVPSAPAVAAPAEQADEPAQPDYVFEMAAQPAEPAPRPEAASAPAVTEPAAPASRPTLPSFEELLAAAAAPAPGDFHDPSAVEPVAEPWRPKSYGAPAPEPSEPFEAPADTVAAEPVAPAAPEAAPVHDVAAVELAAAPAPVFEVAPEPAPVPVFPQSAFPQDALPQPAFPQDALPQPAFPQDVFPQDAFPQDAFPQDAQPAFPQPTFPQDALPQPAAPQPALPQAPVPQPSMPAAPAPVAAPAGFAMPTMPAAPALPPEPGLVMPSAPILDAAPARAEQTARHAEVVAEIVPPVPAAPPAPAPVGYTASADPAVANRYRMALHNPEPEADAQPDPFGAPLMGPYPTGAAPTGAAPASAPNQPGWQGMPLPGAAPVGMPGVAFSPTVPPPYSVAAPAEGSNKTAWTALGSGALAIGLAVLFLFFDRIGLWPALLALAAVVQGTIAAVHSRKVRSGLGAAITAIVLGVVAIVIMVTTAIQWTVNPEYVMDGRSMEVEIVASSEQLGVDLVSATCPADLSGVAGDTLSCTAEGADGTVYPVEITVDSEGYFNWTIVDPTGSA